MRKGFIALFIIGVASVTSCLQLKAQTPNIAQNGAAPASDIYFLNRAKNLARQAAITANGGLGQYRPDPVMYGPAIQTAYVRHDDGSITFRFNGGAPGAPTPKFETVATVSANGVVRLDYNGSPRAISADSWPGKSSMNGPANNPVPITVPEPTNTFSPSTIPLTPSDGPLPGVMTPTSSSVKEVLAGMSPTIAGANQDAFVSRSQNLARQAAIKANGGLAAYRPESSMYGPSARSPFVKNADGSLTFTFNGGAPGASGMTLLSVVIVDPAGNVKIQYNGPPVR